jgi:hypothetical protein
MSASVKRAKPFKLTAPVVREHPLQTQICSVLRIELAPPGKISPYGVVWWSIDHAAYSGEVPGIRIGRGIIAGVPDFFVLFAGRAFMLELKTEAPAAGLSEAQRSVCAAVLAGGGQVGVVRTAAETLGCLDAWAIPRTRRCRL